MLKYACYSLPIIIIDNRIYGVVLAQSELYVALSSGPTHTHAHAQTHRVHVHKPVIRANIK